MPWNLPGDMKHFKEVTTQPQGEGLANVVMMGRKTWESIPEKFRPLPNRLNIVLTRDTHFSLPSEVLKASGLDEALRLLEKPPFVQKTGKIFVIGGAEIFKMAINHPQCQELLLTHIQHSFRCDRFFLPVPSFFQETFRSSQIKETGITYVFVTYRR